MFQTILHVLELTKSSLVLDVCMTSGTQRIWRKGKR